MEVQSRTSPAHSLRSPQTPVLIGITYFHCFRSGLYSNGTRLESPLGPFYDIILTHFCSTATRKRDGDMAQTTYTLDEAAAKLGISVEEFKRRQREETAFKNLRSFRDGSTLRFRANEVDELARVLGVGSDGEGSPPVPSGTQPELRPEYAFDPESVTQIGSAPPTASPVIPPGTQLVMPPVSPGGTTTDAEVPLVFDDSDNFSLAPEDSPAKAPPTRLDSDVGLPKTDKGDKAPAKKEDVESIFADDELSFNLNSPSSKSGRITGDKSGKLTSGKSGKLTTGSTPKATQQSLPQSAEEGSSEFELSLDPDSSSEFELSLTSDSSEEISLGDMPVQRAGNSGINISNPSDSGPSLEGKKKGDSKKKLATSGSSDEIEFVVENKPGLSGKNVGGKNVIDDSDSEFELTLDEDPNLGAMDADTGSLGEQEASNDIFETDFEIPALEDDSGSEVLPMEEADTDLESSDFDLAVDSEEMSTDSDESGSNVDIVDEEDDAPKSKKKKKTKLQLDDDDSGGVSFDDMDLDESNVSASKALRGVKSDDESEDIEAVEDEDGVPVGAVVAAPAPWGPLPALLLLPTVLLAFVGTIMAYEVIGGMFGYKTSPNLVVESVSGLFGVKPEIK